MKSHAPKQDCGNEALVALGQAGEALLYNNERVSTIKEDPKSRKFLFWLVISYYFPVITACMGPLSNMISIVCVVEKWRSHTAIDANGKPPTDHGPTGVFVVNILAFVIGFLSNCVLVLHFIEKLSYRYSQLINIPGWTTAGTMLLVDVCVFAGRDTGGDRHKTIGFWYSVIAATLYSCCTFCLTVHFFGYWLGKYPPKFNLMKNERILMLFTLLLSFLLLWGAGMFSRLLDVTFGTALYYSIVAILTVGLGDITPKNLASKIMIMVFSLIGVVTLGLIVAMTRSVIQDSAGSTIFFHRVEVARAVALKKAIREKRMITRRGSFDKIMHIRRVARRKQLILSGGATVLIYLVFWTLGALVFKFAENWSYFNALYFCFLCLITIGYGDYAPKTGAGRAFFVVWSLAAVPLVSAIISTVGESLFYFTKKLDLHTSKNWNFSPAYNPFFSFSNPLHDLFSEPDQASSDYPEKREDANNPMTNDDEPRNSTSIVALYEKRDSSMISRSEKLSLPDGRFSRFSSERFHSIFNELKTLQSLVQALKEFRSIATNGKTGDLSYEQWNKLMELYASPENVDVLSDPCFWLSEYSPLKFPLNEPKFAISKLFFKIELFLEDLIQNNDTSEYHTLEKGDFEKTSSTIQKNFSIQQCGLRPRAYSI
ncbi:TOK1 (YJL093C) [Zygosaccharomyces parabailii]|uniref:ZYBA0S05-05292g1_1 n=1 Tax=Zygosaccharomyces bailii (strain CLIB 213 / ATCC 58445 / CBS 680 / BCRC 21525 / NBRC 1098 / NCYC 1416 / NRRL Y-2227) TaxID=1333698 RepID=A0A8J2T880_ZYGB2|nr:TOK1 (YJL093C) [Zygosaccharomyces parabailii]CDF89942.1 ZYBA0S05-05292g1_1 [Zygosaccharomyces bailii CLIB 213]